MNHSASPRRVCFEGKYLRIVASGHWEFAERTQCSGAVVIIAVTPEGRVLLVEQYRIPLGKRTIELPAGLAGDLPSDHGEQLATAATRELLEETGYEAASMELLTEGPPSAGLSNEVVTFFMASGLKNVHAGGGDPTEQIIVHEVPLAEIDAWINGKAEAGLAIDPKIFSGLYFLLRRTAGA